MVRRSKNLFRRRQRYRCTVTGKVYTVEERLTNFGPRFLLVSLQSGNPGRFKTAEFLNHQIADGFLERELRPLPELLACYDAG